MTEGDAGARPATGAPIVGVFGGTERGGRWRPPLRQKVIALFGGARLDYREAELPPEALHVDVYAVLGGVEIRVPAGMRVELSGFSLFGGRGVESSGARGDTDTPVMHLRAVAVLGGVAVRADRG